MLISAVLSLSPIEDCQIQPYLGRASHALFLRLINAANPLVAKALHEDEQIKPFTTSSLLEINSPGQSLVTLNRSSSYRLRFTSFESGLSRTLVDEVFTSLPDKVELDGIPFAVKGCTVDGEQDRSAGTMHYAEMAHHWLLSRSDVESRLGFVFHSPTTFRSKGQNVPLPLPGLVFGSLVDRWNAFSPTPVSPDARRFAEECLAVGRYDLRTQMVSVAGGKQVGFVGRCDYVALNKDKYWLHVMGLLSAFAFFSGVGYKTTQGLGRTERQWSYP